MPPTKVVVTGPGGVGKTTFIRSIADMTVATTEPHPSGEGRVTIDFGRITLARDLIIYLYGTPTQHELKEMWDAWTEGMLGFVLLVEGGLKQEQLDEAASYLEHFRSHGEWPFVVAVNRCPGDEDEACEVVSEVLGVPYPDQVMPVDTLDRDSVKNVLLTFLAIAIDPKRAKALAKAGT